MEFNSDVFAFLKEFLTRMSAKSPRFFQVLQTIGMIAALISGLPLALQQFEIFSGVKVFDHLPVVVNSDLIRIVFFCGLIVKIMGKLPLSTPPEANPQKNPFTIKKQ